MFREGLKLMHVYTAIFGRPDVLLEPFYDAWAVPLRCFTDLTFKGKSVWQMVKLRFDDLPPVRRNRKIKIWCPAMFRGYEYSLYVDSNVEILVDPRELIQFLEPGSDICVFRHPERDCLYEEARVVMRRRLDDPEVVRRQVARYRERGVKPHAGLWACTVILRRHTSFMMDFCAAWWAEVDAFSCRDQISFPYIVGKTGAKVSTFPGSLLNNEFISWRPWERRKGEWKDAWVTSRR